MTKHEPILKAHWERFRAHTTLEKGLVPQLLQPYSTAKIIHVTLLSEGCAYSNYKVEFETEPPVVLRIYCRDHDALAREIGIQQTLSNLLPVPIVYHHDASCTLLEHPYAIMEFVDGELMRNVLLTQDASAIDDCAFSAGHNLNALRQIALEHGGFFQDKQLTIRPFSATEQYLPYARSCLEHPSVIESLGASRVQQLLDFLQQHQTFLPNPSESNLTHGDYDPANILVKKVDGHYQVCAVLDWEFAFSGSYLMDIGTFLRYSHKLGPSFEERFIEGLSSGQPLPKHWKKSAKLMDIICLLSLLYWNPKADRPNLCADVCGLIQHTLDNWQQW